MLSPALLALVMATAAHAGTRMRPAPGGPTHAVAPAKTGPLSHGLAPADRARATADLALAAQSFRAGDYGRAQKRLIGLADRLPELRDHVLYLAAESAFYVGDFAQARQLFAALAAQKTSRFAGGAPWREADCRWMEGQREEAAASYRQLLARKGTPAADPALARFRLAEVAAIRSPGEARRLYRVVAVEFPAHPLAEAARQRSEGLVPDQPVASPAPAQTPPEDRLRRATVLAEQRRYGDAIAELEAMTTPLPPALASERDWQLGMAKFRARKDYAGAAALLLGVAPALKGDRAAMAAFHGARALSRADRDDDAIVAYGKVVAAYPHSRWAAEAQFLAGWLEINRRHYKESLPALRATVEHYPRTPFGEDAAWFLVFAHYLTDDAATALQLLPQYERLARSDADAPRRAAYWRARFLDKLGRTEEALAALKDCAAHWPFSFYGLLAQARLRSSGTAALVRLPASREASLALPPAAARDPAVRRTDLLLAAGMEVEAGVELVRAEAGVWKRLGPVGGLATLLDRYPRAWEFHRPYQLAEAHGGSALGAAPQGSSRLFWEAAYPRAYRREVEVAAAEAADPDLFLYAIMRKESGFAPHDVSYADARGLLQMIPPTSARVAEKVGIPFAPDDLFDPGTNIRLGAHYIGDLVQKFRGQLLLAAAAYNAGPRSVMRWCDQHGQRPLDEFVELIAYEQTREYVKRVAGIYARYRFLYGPTPFAMPLTIDPLYRVAGPEY